MVPAPSRQIGLPIVTFRLAARGRVQGTQGGSEDFVPVAMGEAAIADGHCRERRLLGDGERAVGGDDDGPFGARCPPGAPPAPQVAASHRLEASEHLLS